MHVQCIIQKYPQKVFYQTYWLVDVQCDSPLSPPLPPLEWLLSCVRAGGRRRWRKNGVSYICVYAGVGGTPLLLESWGAAVYTVLCWGEIKDEPSSSSPLLLLLLGGMLLLGLWDKWVKHMAIILFPFWKENAFLLCAKFSLSSIIISSNSSLPDNINFCFFRSSLSSAPFISLEHNVQQ